MFGFEKLDVWNLAIQYADLVYVLTESFPQREMFGITNQLRRAAVSISSNIAEGSGRGSNKDFVRFLQIAYGSLMETVSQSTLARNQKFLSDIEYQQVYDLAERLAKMMSRLRTSLEAT